MYKRKRVASLIIVFAMILQMFSTFSTTANAKDIGGIITKASLKTSHICNMISVVFINFFDKII